MISYECPIVFVLDNLLGAHLNTVRRASVHETK